MSTRRWLTLILLAGWILRIVPIWFGLPYTHARPDEETSIGHAIAILRGDPNPHFFHWPSLTFYLFAALFAVAGGETSLGEAQQVLLARGLVAFAGTATIFVLFRIGRRVGGDATGLVAALFLAVSILHVRESHFAMTDVLMTLLATISLALLLRAYDLHRSAGPASSEPASHASRMGAAGLVAGLAASTKYTAVTLIASAAAAHVLLLRRSRQRAAHTWFASAAFAGCFALAFVAATPFAVLDPVKFVEDFRFNVTHLSGGHVVNVGRGWVYHLTRSLPYGVGFPVFIAALAGIVPFVRHHREHALIVGAFAIATYVSVGSGYTVFFRYVLPLVPILCLSAAVGVSGSARLAAVLPKSAQAGLAAAMALWGAINCVWLDALLAKTDTRVLAREWLLTHVTPGETMYEAEDAYAMLDLRNVPVHSWQFDPRTESFVNAGGRTPDWLVLHQSPLWTYAAVPAPLRRLAAERYALAQAVPATKGAARAAVYDVQDAFFLPISGFTTVVRPGPTVLIYRRK